MNRLKNLSDVEALIEGVFLKYWTLAEGHYLTPIDTPASGCIAGQIETNKPHVRLSLLHGGFSNQQYTACTVGQRDTSVKNALMRYLEDVNTDAMDQSEIETLIDEYPLDTESNRLQLRRERHATGIVQVDLYIPESDVNAQLSIARLRDVVIALFEHFVRDGLSIVSTTTQFLGRNDGYYREVVSLGYSARLIP